MIALSKKRILSAIVLAALGAIASKIVGQTWDYYFRPFPLEVDSFVRVAPGKLLPAKGATVDLNIPAVERKTADERGSALWESLDPHPFRTMQVSVTLAGYKMVPGPAVPIRRRWGALKVILDADTPLATTQPNPPTPSAPAPSLIEKVYRSGPRSSGPGKNFGPPSTVCSTDSGIPAGFQILSEHFELIGDRQCNAWAECSVTSKSPTQVCYQFRTQGHEEWTGPLHGLIPSGNAGMSQSEGVLSVVWGPKPAS